MLRTAKALLLNFAQLAQGLQVLDVLWSLDFERLLKDGGTVNLYLKKFFTGHVRPKVTIFFLGWLVGFLRLFLFLFWLLQLFFLILLIRLFSLSKFFC